MASSENKSDRMILLPVRRTHCRYCGSLAGSSAFTHQNPLQGQGRMNRWLVWGARSRSSNSPSYNNGSSGRNSLPTNQVLSLVKEKHNVIILSLWLFPSFFKVRHQWYPTTAHQLEGYPSLLQDHWSESPVRTKLKMVVPSSECTSCQLPISAVELLPKKYKYVSHWPHHCTYDCQGTLQKNNQPVEAATQAANFRPIWRKRNFVKNVSNYPD